VKGHRFGARLRKAIGEQRRERLVGKRVGPQTEHAARPQLRGQPLETLGLVEGGIPRMEQKVRRMIDVDQYGVEAAARRVRVEACAGFR
jgi:hypothetical protein